MRLIDADELRKAFKKSLFFTDVHLHYAREIIDNAPTVIPEDFMNSYEEGYERAKKDFERPQDKWGKWIISEIQCPECLEYFQTDCYSTEELKKCPNCGAKMEEE